MDDWQELAERIASDYAQQVGLDKPSLKFVRYIRKPPGAWAGIKVPTKLMQWWRPVIRLHAGLFSKLFQTDPEFGEVVLRYVVAHELGHLTDPIILRDASKYSCEEGERYAEGKVKEILGLPDKKELPCANCRRVAEFVWDGVRNEYACPQCGFLIPYKDLLGIAVDDILRRQRPP